MERVFSLRGGLEKKKSISSLSTNLMGRIQKQIELLGASRVKAMFSFSLPVISKINTRPDLMVNH